MNQLKTIVRAGRTLRQASMVKALAFTAVVGLTACDSATEPNPGGTPAAISALPRAMTVAETKVRDASNGFSFALLSSVTDSQPTVNTFISPLSVSFALGMTMNGASGATLSEMQHALRFDGLSELEINAGYKSLVELLLSLDPSVQMRIANSIWYRNTFNFHQTFFDTTKKYFNAEVKGLNFADVAGTTNTVNAWVRTATNDRIQKVLSDIDPADVMFLVNAIYFKGTWRAQFDAAKSINSTFTNSSGSAEPARLMNRKDEMAYLETNTYQAVDLPYGNTAYSMTVLLPRVGQDVNSVVRGLNASAWQTLTNAFRTTDVNLALPKIKLEYERQLNSNLIALGMRTPFLEHAADFSRMSPSSLFISFVKQNSFVEINEEGTEAAAVTTVGMQVTSAPVSVTMRVDRPFVFVIRERLTGTIVFMGRIVRMPS